MKTYGNHFRVDDPKNRFLQTHDSGIVSMFEQQIVDARNVSIQYVGIVKDILKLDYGPVQTPIAILRFEWLQRKNNQGNPTYV
jgi:hypothetical protein